MQKADEIQNSLSATLAKYRRNVTQVPMAELEGKYRIPFNNLKKQLRNQVDMFLLSYALEGMLVHKDDIDSFSKSFNKIYEGMGLRAKAQESALKQYSIDEIKKIGAVLKSEVTKIYDEYVYQNTCLCVGAECVKAEDPQAPKIYNSVLRKFWDNSKEEWREPEPGETDNTVLIYIRKGA